MEALSYNREPSKLQAAIRAIHHSVAEELPTIFPETQIIPFPLYKILDGRISSDYVARVEPSTRGGEKMGKALVEALKSVLNLSLSDRVLTSDD